MHQHGGDIYTGNVRADFSANINPLGIPDAVKKAVVEGISSCVHYPDVQCRELVRSLAEHERVPKEWILCGNGAAELIFSIPRILKPKKALLLAPGFAEYEQGLRAAGCEPLFYICKKEQGFMPDERFLSALTDEVDLLFLCNPNNPTGLLIEDRLLDQILQICKEKKIFVVLDECFAELVRPELSISRKSFLAENDGLLILKAFTKTYAMPGLRLGYALCSNMELLQKMREINQPWSVSVLAQLAGVAALKETEYVKKSQRYIEKNRMTLRNEMMKLGLEVFDSQANYLFFRGPEDLADFCAGEGILIRDCGNYRGLGKGWFRVAVRTTGENRMLLEVLRMRMTQNNNE